MHCVSFATLSGAVLVVATDLVKKDGSECRAEKMQLLTLLDFDYRTYHLIPVERWVAGKQAF